MYISSQRHEYFRLKLKRLPAFFKDNLLSIIFLVTVSLFFYKVHMDDLNHSSGTDKFISLSEGWDNLKSNKYMHEMINACDNANRTLKSSIVESAKFQDDH